MVGSGPAGRALAVECAQRGLSTVLVDPDPASPWTSTYASWAGALPPGLPAEAVASRSRGVAITGPGAVHELGWDYVVLDCPALHAHLAAAFTAAGGAVRTGRAVAATDGGVLLADGELVRARVVVDTAGATQPLADAGRRGAARRRPAAQTAYGLVVDAAIAETLVEPGSALFMDWRRDHGEDGPATFLYGVPLGGGRVLLEETSLAARPAVAVRDLERRLRKRLAHHGVAVPDDAPVERVAFPLDRPWHRARHAVGFGAAAPLVHPASGFSVSSALSRAPLVADALAAHIPGDPGAARSAARNAVRPPTAAAVDVFRRIGLEALLAMPPERVPEFFAVFFALPDAARWAYLTGDADLGGVMGTMSTLFARADSGLRRQLLDPRLLPRALRTL